MTGWSSWGQRFRVAPLLGASEDQLWQPLWSLTPCPSAFDGPWPALLGAGHTLSLAAGHTSVGGWPSQPRCPLRPGLDSLPLGQLPPVSSGSEDPFSLMLAGPVPLLPPRLESLLGKYPSRDPGCFSGLLFFFLVTCSVLYGLWRQADICCL